MIMGRGKAETLGACCVLGEGLLMLQVWYFLFRSAGLDLLEPVGTWACSNRDRHLYCSSTCAASSSGKNSM